MNTTNCPHCGQILSYDDSQSGLKVKCPKCHKKFNTLPTKKTPQRASLITIIGALLGTGICTWYFFGGGVEKQVSKELELIDLQIMDDLVMQYEITKRSGSAVDASVAAGTISFAYLQAKDEVNYKKWKKVQEEELRRAQVDE